MVRTHKQPTIADEPKVAVVPTKAVSDASEGEDYDRDYETILAVPAADVQWVKARATYLGLLPPAL